MAEQAELFSTRPAPRQADGPGEDLSTEIAAAVERWPGDSVRCTRVWGSDYRCNWWAPEPTGGYDNPGMHGLLVTTHRVRFSRFLRVTKAAGPDGRLLIEDRSDVLSIGRKAVPHVVE
jgi:hypothetical protein